MMNFSRLALLALLLITACTFSSDEEYFETIEPPDPSKLSIQLSEYKEGDTIRIYQSTTFRYAIDTNGGSIKSVRIKVGDIDYTRSGSSGELYYSSLHSPSGVHVLSIEFISTTGTGSLADVLESEQYTGVHKWVLAADFDTPAKPNIDLKITDGFLRVSWPAYSKPNFKRYRIERHVDSESYVTLITDPKQNFWVDQGFTGGPKSVSYTVGVENTMGYVSSEKTFSHDSNVHFAFNEKDTTVTLKWNKNPFYGAFKEYVIKTFPDMTATISQIEDTVKTFKLDKLLFGSQARVTFETLAKQNAIPSNEVTQTFTLGEVLPVVADVFYSAHLNFFVLQKDSKTLLQLDDDLHPAGEIPITHYAQTLPYPGRYLYAFGSDRMVKTDLVTGETDTRFSGNATITGYAAAGNGVVAVRTYYRNFGKFHYNTLVFDWLTKKNLFSKSVSSTGFDGGVNPLVLADDGNFFLDVVGSKIYKVIPGDTSVLMGSLGTNVKFIGFRKDNSNEFMVEDNTSVAIYSSTTLGLIRKVNTPHAGAQFMYYDPYTKYLLWSNGDQKYLVHIETGAVRYFRASSLPSPYFLNGYLIIPSTGRYIKVV